MSCKSIHGSRYSSTVSDGPPTTNTSRLSDTTLFQLSMANFPDGTLTRAGETAGKPLRPLREYHPWILSSSSEDIVSHAAICSPVYLSKIRIVSSVESFRG